MLLKREMVDGGKFFSSLLNIFTENLFFQIHAHCGKVKIRKV
jgi:hypothetical protein